MSTLDADGAAAYRNHRFRSSWAAAAYHQLQFDAQHRGDSQHTDWYALNNASKLSPTMVEKFVEMSQDPETNEFLDNCYQLSEQLFRQVYHRMAKALLSFFVSVTSANGLLRRGSMFVLSTKQFLRLMDWQNRSEDSTRPPKLESLLDLGAGDGNVTKRFADYFERVHATEMATVMTWRLAELGYSVLDAQDWSAGEPYDLIACLNLLDRCDTPLDLLAQIRRSLRQGSGRLLLAVVLPINQYCEFTPGHQPSQLLRLRGSTLEEQANSLVVDVLEPQGWQLERWTKLPYLCEGDLYQSFYHLNDAVFVLKPA